MDRVNELLSFDYFKTFSDYGYGGKLEEIRGKEFRRIKGITYLDHAGTTLFPQSLLDEFTKDLSENVYGNPHSQNISSRLTHDTIEHVRYRILRHFNTTPEEYTVIFTSGSTAGLKLVGESFPWTKSGQQEQRSQFCYLIDNHTSVVGMRDLPSMMNVLHLPVQLKDISVGVNGSMNDFKMTSQNNDQNSTTLHLFCYPAQSNFSGKKYPLSWIQEIKSGRLSPFNKSTGKWLILLDAASYVCTSPLNLKVHQADFIPISFYKIFGFPTGLGALLVHNDSAALLRKTYFGGGTAAAYLAGEDYYIPRHSVAERFEDGTISFLDIIALKHGFDILEKLTGGMEKIKIHTFDLAHYTYSVLSALKYENGQPAVRIYTDNGFNNSDIQGPIINFNMLNENGEVIGYSQVDNLAHLYNIQFRTGCFCNTGACQQHLKISNSDIKRNLQVGHVCGDNIDIIDGNPTGSVRISFGYMSTFEDAQTFLKFIINTFLKNATQQCGGQIIFPTGTAVSLKASSESQSQNQESENGENLLLKDNCSAKGSSASSSETKISPSFQLHDKSHMSHCSTSDLYLTRNNQSGKSAMLSNIFLYPIKSCAAFEVKEWPLGNQGLLYDRIWMIVNQNGVCLTQKHEPRLCLISPVIDLDQGIMHINVEGMDPVSVPLEDDENLHPFCDSKVCGDRVRTYDCGEEVADWLSLFLQRRCRLIRQSSHFSRKSKKVDDPSEPAVSLSLVNKAQYLLINRESVQQLKELIRGSEAEASVEEISETKELINRFRANLVISGTKPYEEEEWSEVAIGNICFQVVGQCSRCQMICVDQQTGKRSKEPFQSLASYRSGKVPFGIYLLHQTSDFTTEDAILSVGSHVYSIWKKGATNMNM